MSSCPDEQFSTIAEHLLRLPTIHVHGMRNPGLEQHRKLLYEFWDERHARLVEWDGDHRVPIKTKDVTVIVREILSMAKDIGVLKL